MPSTPPGPHGSSGGKQQSKSVTVTYGAVSAVLLIVIAAVALIVKPPSPPALAEFAPQTDKTIDDTSDNLSSRFGQGGDGICAAGQVGCEGVGRPADTVPEDGAEPPLPPPQKPGTRCYGDPPNQRQTEDPQSPPCVEGWEGDNGGSTWTGVTGNEIRVSLSPSRNYLTFETLDSLVQYFNRRYVFYGRSLVLVDLQGAPNLAQRQPAPEVQRRTADLVAGHKVFANLTFGPGTGIQTTLRSRLADHKVLSILTDDDFTTESTLKSLHPYAWGYHLTYDRLLDDLAQFMCRTLGQGNAQYGGPAVQGLPRSVAVVELKSEHADLDGSVGDSKPLLEGLKACGGPRSVHEHVYGGGQADQTDANVLMADLRDRGVTTVVPLGMSLGISELMRAASEVGYQPEWVTPGGGGPTHLDGNWYQAANAIPPEQGSHVISLGGWNKELPVSDRASSWAYYEQGADFELTATHRRHAEQFYEAMLVLASGIQAAGPRLTPETFGRGLQGLRFPNPGAAAPPYYQATVGFTGDHTMIDDEAMQWWSATAPTYGMGQPGAGGWCYVDSGARWRRNQWPRPPVALQDIGKPCR